MQELREYQKRGEHELRQSFANGKRKPVLVLPTGSGKTTTASDLTRKAVLKNNKVLFVVHRQELVYQARDRFKEFGIEAGIIMGAKHKYEGHLVNVASIQTLIRRTLPPADLVFIDEVQHSRASSYKKVIDHYRNSYIIGLTATPWRLDRKPLGLLFDDVVAPIDMKSLIDLGYLVKPRYWAAKNKIDLKGVHTVCGEYDANELFKKANVKILYDGVIDNYKKYGQNKKTIVFCVNVEHSVNTCNAFTEAGFKAAHVDGTTPDEKRKEIVAGFTGDKYDVLSNCNIFGEGLDIPAVSTVIINKATKSKGLYQQMVGRGLRPFAGKEYCAIIDHGDNVKTHGFVEEPQEYDIFTPENTRKNGKGKGPATTKQCPNCYAIISVSYRECPECKHEFKNIQKIETELAEFEELISRVKPSIPRRLWKPYSSMSRAELEEMCFLKGYKKGWIWHQLKRRKLCG